MFTGRERTLPWSVPAGAAPVFPNPRHERGCDGLVAIGGDLSRDRLLVAYRNGIFPWFSEGSEILWWSPDPRTIIEMDRSHVSRSLRRRLLRQPFEITVDRAFRQVMLGCGDRPEGTWILPSMLDAYTRLHHAGHAHSFEVWQNGKLVGGLYGVAVGSAFAAESMFSRVSDASKAALVVAHAALRKLGVRLFDVQYMTDHLESMGASEISRDAYLARLETLRDLNLDFSKIVLDWRDALDPAEPPGAPKT